MAGNISTWQVMGGELLFLVEGEGEKSVAGVGDDRVKTRLHSRGGKWFYFKEKKSDRTGGGGEIDHGWTGVHTSIVNERVYKKLKGGGDNRGTILI